MSDLQEIRRFWPKAKEFDVFGPLYVAKPFGATSFVIMECADGTYLAKRRKTAWSFTGPTIAAAMAAAGFAERKKGFFAEYNQVDTAVWLRVTKRHADKYAGRTRIPLVFRQRPRKGVRLGRRGRRLAFAASMGHAWDWSRNKRLDRKEIVR